MAICNQKTKIALLKKGLTPSTMTYLGVKLTYPPVSDGSMGGQAECCVCADTEARTPIDANGNKYKGVQIILY